MPPHLLTHSTQEEEIRVSEAGVGPVGEAAVRFVRLQILKDFSIRHVDSKEYACSNWAWANFSLLISKASGDSGKERLIIEI